MKAPAITAVAASVLLLLAGCASSPVDDPAISVPPSALPTSPTPTVSPTADAVIEPPTCENLIAAQTVTDFRAVGWEPRQEPFMIGATELDGGLLCKWGDPDGSGEGLQIFGWAPITETQRTTAKADLLADGWRVVETAEGDFVTESTDTAFATGAQGYGLTYEFGDGWVIFADTKQSLLLIQRPGA